MQRRFEHSTFFKRLILSRWCITIYTVKVNRVYLFHHSQTRHWLDKRRPRVGWCSRGVLAAQRVINAAAMLVQWSVATRSRYFDSDWSPLASCGSAHPVQTVSAGRPKRCWHWDSTNIVIDLLQPVAVMPSRHSVMRWAMIDSLFIPRTGLQLGERALRIAIPRRRINSTATSFVSTTLTLLRRKKL